MINKAEIELIFTRRFCMGHRLISCKSPLCAVPHGHNEFVKVVLTAKTAEVALDGEANMVLPFADAKRRWHKFIDERVDHVFQVSDKDPLLVWFKENEPQRLDRIMVTPGDPTTELVAALLFAKLEAFLKSELPSLKVKSLEIEETPTNTVKITQEPHIFIPTNSGLNWWNRADDTISG